MNGALTHQTAGYGRYGEGLIYLIDVENGSLDDELRNHLSRVTRVQHNKGREDWALTCFVVGYKRAGSKMRTISFEYGHYWSSRMGYTYFEINIDNGLNVPEVVESLGKELRSRETLVASESKERYFQNAMRYTRNPRNNGVVFFYFAVFIFLCGVSSNYLILDSVYLPSKWAECL